MKITIDVAWGAEEFINDILNHEHITKISNENHPGGAPCYNVVIEGSHFALLCFLCNDYGLSQEQIIESYPELMASPMEELKIEGNRYTVTHYYLATGMDGIPDTGSYGIVVAESARDACMKVAARRWPDDQATRSFMMSCLSANLIS